MPTHSLTSVKPLELKKTTEEKRPFETSFDLAISALEEVHHSVIALMRDNKINPKEGKRNAPSLKRSNKLINDTVDLLIDVKEALDEAEEMMRGYNRDKEIPLREETTSSD
jgi:hypothetical protein